MASSRRTWEIFPSSTPVTASTLTLLGTGSDGTLGAKRRLVHPDGISFLPISYFIAPDRTLGMDNEVLPRVQGVVVRTEETSTVVRHAEFDSDVLITETWTGGGKRLSMPTFQARLLYEYAVNPPAFDVLDPKFITWEPRDKNTKKYNIVIVSFNIGGSDEGIDFDEVRGAEGGEVAGPLEGLDVSPTGGIIEEVVFVFKIVGEVT